MPRLYTLREANSLIPRLTRLLQTMQTEERRLEMLRGRAAAMQHKTTGNGNHNPGEDVSLAQATQQVEEALRGAARQLREWEIELKDVQLGLVDFPALREGRTVFLCWRLGEPEVAFWHETTSGYADRQPVDGKFEGAD